MGETILKKEIDGDSRSLETRIYQGAIYSLSILKSYDRERHIKLDSAYELLQAQQDNNLSTERLNAAIDSKQIHLYEFNGIKYLDRLDIGRIYHEKKEKKEGLTIDRYFTDGETNPFETVGEYERRCLEIKKIDEVFQMDDAEFPKSWRDDHSDIVGDKYFYKPKKEEWKQKLINKIGKDYEFSPVYLITRVTNFITDEGYRLGYFKTEEDREAFRDELKFIQVHQMFAFNSPVQFNAGLFSEYGIEGSPGINYFRDPETGEITKIEEGSNIKPQCHACFIKGPSDNLESIAQHAVDETAIFSCGSGIGQDIGALRAKGEPLSGGGKASGPLSFWKFYDNVGGTIKSGGKSRRAARMTTMRYHHPDIMEFIRSKIGEDKKALVLMKNGYESGMDGEAYTTVSFQNTNISVRLDDEFFKKVEEDGKVELRRVTDGKVVDRVSAKRMLQEIAFGSWRIGDPAVQYESKIQEMHTTENSGRINSSNPCSEYMHLNYTSCNLGSYNLLKFCDAVGRFLVEPFKKATRLVSTALDIINDAASYPVESIARISPEFRTIGLGYANLGAFLMRRGVLYDSDEGRALAGAITALMTGNAYEASAEMAEKLGTFTHFEFNKKPMLEVMRKHQKNLDDIIWEYVPDDLREAAYQSWKNVIELGEKNGFRNAQTTLLAPTGTISFLMGCDTTGVEPAYQLKTYKKLAGGGTKTLTIREVPNALKNLGYNEGQIEEISEFIKINDTVRGAPHINPSHYPIFDSAVGDGKGNGFIEFEGHVRMLEATQPFLSGAASKTNNLPEKATVKDIYDGYILGHKLGLKALAVFRDKAKPISAMGRGEENYFELKRGEKEDLPNQRIVYESEVKIEGVPIHVLTSEYEDGRVGQIAFLAYKEGSDIGSLLKLSGIQASKALKRGVHIDDILDCWMGHVASPNGLVFGDPFIKTCTSPLDYAAKLIALQYRGNTEVVDNKEGLDISKLRGAQNGAFKTYERSKIDDWDVDQVLNDPELGGFTKSKTNGKSSSNETPKQQKKQNNERGVACKSCGNIMNQTAPNCYECNNCGDKTGGCGQ